MEPKLDRSGRRSARRVTRAVALTASAVALAAGVAAPAAQAAAPKRIVALTPFTANTLVALGKKPVGIGETLGGKNRLSRKLRGVKRLPLSHPNGPNLEQLASLNPGLVLSAPIWRKGSAGMRSLDIKVVESDPRSVRGVARETRRIGKLLGRSKAAAKLSARFAKKVRRAQRRIKRRPRVLLLLAVGRTPFAALGNSWGGDLVKRSGGGLLTRGLRANGGFARISNETVVDRNPDVIIAVPHAETKDIPRLAKYLRTNPAWQDTNAAKKGRVYVSTDNSLLQADTDAARTISRVRSKYLKNK